MKKKAPQPTPKSAPIVTAAGGDHELTLQENTFPSVAERLYSSVVELLQMNVDAAASWLKKDDPSLLSDIEEAFEQGYAVARLLRQAQETAN